VRLRLSAFYASIDELMSISVASLIGEVVDLEIIVLVLGSRPRLDPNEWVAL